MNKNNEIDNNLTENKQENEQFTENNDNKNENGGNIINQVEKTGENDDVVIAADGTNTNIPGDNPINLNTDYYDEFNRPKYDQIIEYENKIREEIEKSSPLVSDKMDIAYLSAEFSGSIFEESIKDVINRYKYIRTVRRDGNCFYRSFIFRLFEELCDFKLPKLYNHIIKVCDGFKALCERHGPSWMVLEDFYNMFISEWKFIYQLDPNNKNEYLKMLFEDKEKGNYMVVFIRMAYLKENSILYEGFIDDSIEAFCLREVEPVDVEADHIQIIATTNAFEIGVIIEQLYEKKIDTIRFPEEGSEYFIKLFFRPGHYDILYDK